MPRTPSQTDQATNRPVARPEGESSAQRRPRDVTYDGHPDFSQDAAANLPPKGIGNSEPLDEREAQTRHSNGINPPKREGSTRTDE